jgi:hypothetical protein
LARVLEPASRFSAVLFAEVHAACAVLGIERGFDEERPLRQSQKFHENEVGGEGGRLRIPTPSTTSRASHLPEALPHPEVRVDTRKKLPEQSKRC